MRFSMLVYLIRMGQTLLEAEEYLATRPKEDPVREELLENGLQMLEQMRAELGRHRRDLKSSRPIDCLNEAEKRWRGGEECAAALRQLVECLPREVRYRLRAVFFAELGEKWDSMDSVYRFMRDDPRFDPVVVLTPVLRQVEENGEIKRDVIYKDYLTSMGIPFFHYDRYSLEEDCPDMAFISQPYESCTLKEFWPDYITQYTRLVYLPYFLAFQINVTIQELREAYAMGAYRLAWKIPVTTEKELSYYRRFSEHGGANALLTGVPKLDGLTALPKREIARPAGWECLKGKTVFLWNTWYGLPTSSMPRYIDTLIEWFQAHEDCALLWRAHPMTDSVIKLYYPKYYPKLQENIQRINSLPNACFDQETSFGAAFHYSDALISDYSSMLPQYLFMDKPALMTKHPLNREPVAELVDSQWIEQATDAAGVIAFLERIRAGEDRGAELRKEIRQRDLPLADGHCAERLCETLWTELHREML